MKILVSFPWSHDSFRVWSVDGGSNWSEPEMRHQARVHAWDAKVAISAVVDNGNVIEVCDANLLSLFQLALSFITCETCDGCELCDESEDDPLCDGPECSECDDMDGFVDSALNDAHGEDA